MDAVKDPGCGANEAIEKLVKEWQVQLLRLCYIQLQDQSLAEGALRRMQCRRPFLRHTGIGHRFAANAAKRPG